VGQATLNLSPGSWEAIGAFCCFAGGIGAAIVGSVLTAVTWMLGAELHPWVRGIGTGFLVLTIPLLILAGYCLDWLEETKSKQAAEISKAPEPAAVISNDRKPSAAH
jgi:hypothetical protein